MKTWTLCGAQTDSVFGLGCPNAVNVPLTVGAAGRTDALPSGGNSTLHIGGNTALQAFHWFIDWFLLNKKEMMKSISGWWLVCCHFWLKTCLDLDRKLQNYSHSGMQSCVCYWFFFIIIIITLWVLFVRSCFLDLFEDPPPDSHHSPPSLLEPRGYSRS